jgi:hypothetical protein|tara:strand:- start:1183 stop:2325 length:1143 start_codon:yes stop_codon:yes gene_type:complete
MAKQPAKGRKTPQKPKTKPAVAKAVEADIVAPEIVETPAVEDPVSEIEPEILEPVIEATEIPAAPFAEPAKSGSAMPAILGGLVAGAIGFGAAYFVLPKPDMTLPAKISAQASEITELRDQIAAVPAPDLSGVEAAQAATADAMVAADERITALETRLNDLSNRAGDSGSVSTAAYEAELDALRSEMENLRGTAIAELESAREQAAEIENNAEAAARAATGRASLARIQSGMETGAPLGEALDDLAAALQADVPAALTAVRDGTPTLAALQSDFPALARAALATARAEGVSGEAEGGFASFLRNQFDVRSVAPKDGDGTDAILSRAEATLRHGRLTDALAEVGALPEVARAELSDWIALAEARADALAAAATLSTSLNDN